MLPQFWFILTTVANNNLIAQTKSPGKNITNLFKICRSTSPRTPRHVNLIELQTYNQTPYLNSRMNLLRWARFYENKICPPSPDE